MSDAQIDGDGIYFTQQDLISAVESQFRNVYRVNQLSLKRLDTPFIQSASKSTSATRSGLATSGWLCVVK